MIKVCIECNLNLGDDLIKIDNHVRNVCSLPFEDVGKYAHPECIGLMLCPGCHKHWVLQKACGCNPLVNAVAVKGR